VPASQILREPRSYQKVENKKKEGEKHKSDKKRKGDS
jgi:hypothetical protein